MKEVIHLLVRVELEYRDASERKAAVTMAKEITTQGSEWGYLWKINPTSAKEFKKVKSK
jgi:hypothetical protein